MKPAKTVIIALMALTATAALTALAQTTPTYENTEAWSRWVQAYRILAELSKAGMNTTQYTQKLRQALQALRQGNYQQAQDILDQTTPELRQLHAQKESYILADNIRKYATVAAILSIPPLTYYLLPRAYVKTWYRLRKKWIMEG